MYSESKSTDKLHILCECAKHLPTSLLEKIEVFTLDWKVIDGDMIIPTIHCKFKDD